MKTFFFSLLLTILFTTNLKAQEIYFEVKNQINFTDVKFTSGTVSNDGDPKTDYNLSFGLAAKLSKNFFFKTTIGSNDFRDKVTLRWSSIASHEVAGEISIKQRYFELLPELRFLKGKWIYFNMGMGFNQVRSSELSKGIYTRDSEVFFANETFPNFGGKYEYFVGHIGINLSYKDFGLILEYGYRTSGFTEFRAENPGIGINQESINFGLSFRIR